MGSKQLRRGAYASHSYPTQLAIWRRNSYSNMSQRNFRIWRGIVAAKCPNKPPNENKYAGL
eukprot:1422594-Amphidinium_carterae.1